jgi:hypothetical protein
MYAVMISGSNTKIPVTKYLRKNFQIKLSYLQIEMWDVRG